MGQIIKYEFYDATDTQIPQGSQFIAAKLQQDGTYTVTVQPNAADGTDIPPIVIEGCTHPHHAPKLI